jgi:hypothetical protein
MPEHFIPSGRCNWCGTTSRAAMLFEDCRAMILGLVQPCPVCGTEVDMGSGVILGSSFHSLVFDALDAVLTLPEPASAIRKAMELLGLAKSADDVAAIAEKPGFGWIREILPKEGDHRRQSIQWMIGEALVILGIIVTTINSCSSGKPSQEQIRRAIEEYEQQHRDTRPSQQQYPPIPTAPTPHAMNRPLAPTRVSDAALTIKKIAAIDEDDARQKAAAMGISVDSLYAED